MCFFYFYALEAVHGSSHLLSTHHERTSSTANYRPSFLLVNHFLLLVNIFQEEARLTTAVPDTTWKFILCHPTLLSMNKGQSTKILISSSCYFNCDSSVVQCVYHLYQNSSYKIGIFTIGIIIYNMYNIHTFKSWCICYNMRATVGSLDRAAK